MREQIEVTKLTRARLLAKGSQLDIDNYVQVMSDFYRKILIDGVFEGPGTTAEDWQYVSELNDFLNASRHTQSNEAFQAFQLNLLKVHGAPKYTQHSLPLRTIVEVPVEDAQKALQKQIVKLSTDTPNVRDESVNVFGRAEDEDGVAYRFNEVEAEDEVKSKHYGYEEEDEVKSKHYGYEEEDEVKSKHYGYEEEDEPVVKSKPKNFSQDDGITADREDQLAFLENELELIQKEKANIELRISNDIESSRESSKWHQRVVEEELIVDPEQVPSNTLGALAHEGQVTPEPLRLQAAIKKRELDIVRRLLELELEDVVEEKIRLTGLQKGQPERFIDELESIIDHEVKTRLELLQLRTDVYPEEANLHELRTLLDKKFPDLNLKNQISKPTQRFVYPKEKSVTLFDGETVDTEGKLIVSLGQKDNGEEVWTTIGKFDGHLVREEGSPIQYTYPLKPLHPDEPQLTVRKNYYSDGLEVYGTEENPLVHGVFHLMNKEVAPLALPKDFPPEEYQQLFGKFPLQKADIRNFSPVLGDPLNNPNFNPWSLDVDDLLTTIKNRVFYEDPELAKVIVQPATDVVHPKPNEPITLYNGKKYNASQVSERSQNIISLGKTDNDQHVWFDTNEGLKGSGRKKGFLKISPKSSKSPSPTQTQKLEAASSTQTPPPPPRKPAVTIAPLEPIDPPSYPRLKTVDDKLLSVSTQKTPSSSPSSSSSASPSPTQARKLEAASSTQTPPPPPRKPAVTTHLLEPVDPPSYPRLKTVDDELLSVSTQKTPSSSSASASPSPTQARKLVATDSASADDYADPQEVLSHMNLSHMNQRQRVIWEKLSQTQVQGSQGKNLPQVNDTSDYSLPFDVKPPGLEPSLRIPKMAPSEAAFYPWRAAESSTWYEVTSSPSSASPSSASPSPRQARKLVAASSTQTPPPPPPRKPTVTIAPLEPIDPPSYPSYPRLKTVDEKTTIS